MLIGEAKSRFCDEGRMRLQDCVKHARTLVFRRKYDAALRRVEAFLEHVRNPVISCGGGKDSTAVALIARKIEPKIQIWCADPPNPFADRETHVKTLLEWLGGPCERFDYVWKVDAVLEGRERYPEGLKLRTLQRRHQERGVDGVILGVRASESKTRKLNLSRRGYVYETATGWRCQPIADMSAAESLCVALMSDAPINPVYTKQMGELDFDHIRDGTWWPHGKVDNSAWMRRYYPEHYEDYRAASLIYDGRRSVVCTY